VCSESDVMLIAQLTSVHPGLLVISQPDAAYQSSAAQRLSGAAMGLHVPG
jgi:hypothetical protein